MGNDEKSEISVKDLSMEELTEAYCRIMAMATELNNEIRFRKGLTNGHIGELHGNLF